MYSTFNISDTDCMSCTNITLKTLGTLRGVFGAEIDRINGQVVVNHTNEVSRQEISEVLESLGFKETPPVFEPDEPSIWGCAL